MPQRILDQLHGAAWREEVGKGSEWNSEANNITFGQVYFYKRKKMGFTRRTRANAVPRWEGPMVLAWGAAWRMEVRAGSTWEGWKAGRDEFAKIVGEAWEIRGIRVKTKKEEEGGAWWEKREKKEEEDEDDKGGQRRYKAHPKDRHWDDVGKRVKLVVDNQATAMILNRKAVCKSEFFRSTIMPEKRRHRKAA